MTEGELEEIEEEPIQDLPKERIPTEVLSPIRERVERSEVNTAQEESKDDKVAEGGEEDSRAVRRKKRRARRANRKEEEEENMEKEMVELPRTSEKQEEEEEEEKPEVPQKEEEDQSQQEEDHQAQTTKLIDAKEPEEERLIHQMDPIVTRGEKIEKDFNQHMTYISELRPVSEGVKNKIGERATKLMKLHTYYISKQKTKEAEECKAVAEALLKQVEKLSQDYSSKYRYFDPQEEGIFTEKKPFLLEKGQYILEHRLMRENEGLSKFFDENGQLIIQPDPTNTVFTKPGEGDFDFMENGSITLRRTTPTRSLRSANASKHYKIDLDIREVKFADHPLMTEEEIVANKIREAYERYQELKEANKFMYYYNRISVCSWLFVLSTLFRPSNRSWSD